MESNKSIEMQAIESANDEFHYVMGMRCRLLAHFHEPQNQNSFKPERKVLKPANAEHAIIEVLKIK